MLVIVVTFFLLVAALGIVAARRRLFLWRERRENQIEIHQSPRQINLFGLDARDFDKKIERERQRLELSEKRERLIAWASVCRFETLSGCAVNAADEMRESRREAIEILIERADDSSKIVLLTEFVLKNDELEPTNRLARKFYQNWQAAPDYRTTIQLFQLIARCSDADLFTDALTTAEQLVKSGRFADFNLSQLRELAASHYWLLGESSRLSGAGFWLKQKLANLKKSETRTK